MSKGTTCIHLNKLADGLEKEQWHSKEFLQCLECGSNGPNLWLCLRPDCQHVGCSENDNDHSTAHHQSVLGHCVHMNVSTERVWCYVCEKEIHIQAALAANQASLTTTATINLPADHNELDLVMQTLRTGEDVIANIDDEDEDGFARGLVGLQNMGNTCYMNAALQALSNTPPLARYFLHCPASVQVLAGDKKPGLSRSYQKLVQNMWTAKTHGYVVPHGILYSIRDVHPMFRGYQQHDTQEFLRCFLDQLHEELKEPVDTPLQAPPAITAQPTKRYQRDSSEEGRRRSRPSTPTSYAGDLCRKVYERVHRMSEGGGEGGVSSVQSDTSLHSVNRHRRAASLGGSGYTPLPRHEPAPDSEGEHCRSPDCAVSDCTSSEEDGDYETCSSGGASDDNAPTKSLDCEPGTSEGGVRYRSVISDVFDGKLLSSVQCLTCDRVSTRIETFQDLSLPIPSREHIALLRTQSGPPTAAPTAVTPLTNIPTTTACGDAARAKQQAEGWVWWLLGWLKSWLYGPTVSLQDCLAAFFSADELKGDNMYSCSRCKKLRNGVKVSRVLRLPEVLCVHLKRFRHELSYSAKVAARVAFPLRDLDMRPYLHKDCASSVHRYELCAVICHAGTAGGGHYTCVARGAGGWHEYDDNSVTPRAPTQVQAAEAYVLFYRKSNPTMTALRRRAAQLMKAPSPTDTSYYVSRQWINRFNTWGEPGRVESADVVCCHGGVRPERARAARALAVNLPANVWRFLLQRFGGGSECTALRECIVCTRAAKRLQRRMAHELGTFQALYQAFQDGQFEGGIYGISMTWMRSWQAFVTERSPHPPPPIDNNAIVTRLSAHKDGTDTSTNATQTPIYVVKPGAEHAQVSEDLWRFFLDLYGGGPEVRIRQKTLSFNQPAYNSLPTRSRHSSKNRSDSSDREHGYRNGGKSASTADVPNYNNESKVKTTHSLQNIDGKFQQNRIRRSSSQSSDDCLSKPRRISNSEEETSVHRSRVNRYRIKNCSDTDEDMSMEVDDSRLEPYRYMNGNKESSYSDNDNKDSSPRRILVTNNHTSISSERTQMELDVLNHPDDCVSTETTEIPSLDDISLQSNLIQENNVPTHNSKALKSKKFRRWSANKKQQKRHEGQSERGGDKLIEGGDGTDRRLVK